MNRNWPPSRHYMLFVAGMAIAGLSHAQQGTLAPPIAPGAKPNQGCVDCHNVRPGTGRDVRLSTILGRWAKTGAPADIVALAARTLPEGAKLTGRHPDVAETVRGGAIPDVCIDCHARNAGKAPRFANLLHMIKYVRVTSGRGNNFTSNFGGLCIHCHQLDTNNGRWHVKNGRELGG